jgi:GH43 family beta-xylosidase
VLEDAGRLYMIWSGWEGDVNGVQSLYIAELSDPWTVKGPRTRISTPQYGWERVGDLKGEPSHVDVNEGPEVLRRGNRIFVVYSASGCWTDEYGMGMLTAEGGSDLRKAESWKKSATPVFSKAPENGAFGPGHGSFFRSADGSEDWMLYHANAESGQGCGRRRAPRAQRFGWKPDGTPDFGRPVAIGSPVARPSGGGL